MAVVATLLQHGLTVDIAQINVEWLHGESGIKRLQLKLLPVHVSFVLTVARSSLRSIGGKSIAKIRAEYRIGSK